MDDESRQFYPGLSTLQICQRVRDHENKMREHEYEVAKLKADLQRLTGKDYDDFMDGMRRLLAPIEN